MAEWHAKAIEDTERLKASIKRTIRELETEKAKIEIRLDHLRFALSVQEANQADYLVAQQQARAEQPAKRRRA